ncbi:MAG: HAMP domain-containing sensor histidine kinase [Betaproteobacteria bacterium]
MSSHLSISDECAGYPPDPRATREDGVHASAEALLLDTFTVESQRLVAVEALARHAAAMARAAHELRNPLAPIRTVAALLGNPARLHDLPRLGVILERQVLHLSRLIDDLMDVARMTSGKLHLDRRRFDLHEVLEHVVDVCQPAMQARHQHLVVTLPARPLTVDGDVVRLAQVFANLLDNAAKYTPEGGRIALSCTAGACPTGAGAGAVTITVADNGIGITPEALPRIFDPFMQDPLAVDFGKQGLGIGLTLVRELVRAHGGTVTAAGAGAGLGSEFVVVLPLA